MGSSGTPIPPPIDPTIPVIALTVQDIIYTAYRLNGVLRGPGQTASQSEVSDALAALNSMLDSWATERLIVYRIRRDLFALTAAKGDYYIGPDAPDFNRARPVRIERASVISNGVEYPIDVYNYDDWQRIPVKTAASSLPVGVYYEAANPIGVLRFYPVPSSGIQAALYTWDRLTVFTDASDAIELPPGYRKAVEYNLAVELSPRFPRPLNPLVLQQARDAKAAIKRLNMPILQMRCDEALLSGRMYGSIADGTL
jgi:hypothetical protein